MTQEPTVTERLNSLWDHLGLTAAHVATQMSGDVAGLARAYFERIAGLLLCVPSRLVAAPFLPAAARLVMVSAERGTSADVTIRAEATLPGSRRVVLDDYDAPRWADVVADRTDEITTALFSLGDEATVPGLKAGSGVHAGITYMVHGKGPALVLLPFFLAPSQWEPAIPDLARHFTVIVLGGRHLGGVAALEDRASGPSYAIMINGMFDVIAPAAGESILDVGCGSGALDRMLARRFGDSIRIIAADSNPFLLREAAALADEDGVADRITFRQDNPERLPFQDDTFDHAFSVTVLEECDADLALRELWRVVRPGGRVGVIVRAIDMPQWWHLTLPETIRRKAEIPPQSNGQLGVADASLYGRMQSAGFEGLTCFPAMVTLDHPDGAVWRYREDHVLSQLTEEETGAWRAATDAARQAGLLFMSNPLHRAVGKKPAA